MMEWIHCPALENYKGELDWLVEKAVGKNGIFMVLSPARDGRIGFHGYFNEIKIIESQTLEMAKAFCEERSELDDPFRGSHMTGYDMNVTIRSSTVEHSSPQ